MSDIDLKEHPELSELFPGLTRVPSGVCSIQLSEGSSPWIICPRRLLYMGRKASEQILRGETQTIDRSYLTGTFKMFLSWSVCRTCGDRFLPAQRELMLRN